MQDFARQMRNLGRDQARAMRDKARSEAAKRKEEYLGARVPKELRDRVIAEAEALGVPVSILIRNVLEQAFGAQKAQGAMPRAEQVKPRPTFPQVIGWERIVLNRSMPCASCATDIEAGASVALGFAVPGEDHVILCAKCKELA
ncbi:MAG: hypothetical protein LBV36_08350 [Chromatiales bacterium]|jgi:hypothetical protein|nr:hypothetical protein [Chromatiales bacterium]